MGFHHRTILGGCRGRSTRKVPQQVTMHAVAANGRIVLARRWPDGLTRARITLGSDRMPLVDGGALLSSFLAHRGSAYGWPYRDIAEWSTAGDVMPDSTDPEHWTYQAFVPTGGGGVELVMSYGDTPLIRRQRRVTKPIPPGDQRHLILLAASTSDISPQITPAGNNLLQVGKDFTVDWDQGFARFVTPLAVGLHIWACMTFHTPVRWSQQSDRSLRFVREGSTPDGIIALDASLEETGLSDPQEHHDEWPMGGAVDHTLDASANATQLDLADGLYQRLNDPPFSNYEVQLPDARDLSRGSTEYTGGLWTERGGPYLILENTHATRSIVLKGATGGLLIPSITVGPKRIVTLGISDPLSENGWKVM